MCETGVSLTPKKHKGLSFWSFYLKKSQTFDYEKALSGLGDFHVENSIVVNVRATPQCSTTWDRETPLVLGMITRRHVLWPCTTRHILHNIHSSTTVASLDNSN